MNKYDFRNSMNFALKILEIALKNFERS